MKTREGRTMVIRIPPDAWVVGKEKKSDCIFTREGEIKATVDVLRGTKIDGLRLSYEKMGSNPKTEMHLVEYHKEYNITDMGYMWLTWDSSDKEYSVRLTLK